MSEAINCPHLCGLPEEDGPTDIAYHNAFQAERRHSLELQSEIDRLRGAMRFIGAGVCPKEECECCEGIAGELEAALNPNQRTASALAEKEEPK